MERRTAYMFTALALLFLLYSLVGGLEGCQSTTIGDSQIFEDIGARHGGGDSTQQDDGPLRINPF